MGKSTISMVIFNSYFDITRGYTLWYSHHFPSPKNFLPTSTPVQISFSSTWTWATAIDREMTFTSLSIKHIPQKIVCVCLTVVSSHSYPCIIVYIYIYVCVCMYVYARLSGKAIPWPTMTHHDPPDSACHRLSKWSKWQWGRWALYKRLVVATRS